MRIRRALVAVLLVAGCASSRQSVPDQGGVTTVIVVRHAEKAAEPASDPPLTPAGTARAELLAQRVGGLPVAAVLSTDFVRTRSTAAPVATRFGLATELVDARAPDHPRQVADGVLARHRGTTVVVVGHSNTVPEIVAALGASKPAQICDGEYDGFYVVRVPGQGAATVEHHTYGAPSADLSCRGK